ncbi:MAG TPA: porin [Thermomonas sp.]|nr:porin [Thermomonas sp.]
MNTHTRSFRATAIALAVLGVLAAGQAGASGFQLREQSVKNLGKSSAGSMVGKDAAVVALNPAAMVNLDQNTFQADLTVIDLTAKFSGGGNILGSPLAPVSGGDGGDPGDPTLVPNMSAVFPLHGGLEGMTVGFAIGAPFGLKTDYDADWVGRYRALTSDLKVIDFTSSVAFDLSDGLSIGVGLVYERAEATLSKAIDFGTAICAQAAASVPTSPANTCFNPQWPLYPVYHPQSADGTFEVNGADNGIGYVIGVQLAPSDRFAIGFSHRSEIRHDLHGTLKFDGVPSILGADPRFQDGDGGAQLTTPTVTTLSVKYAVADGFRLLADYQRTGWSSLRDVTIKRDSGVVVGSEAFDWHDTKFYSLGAEYDISPAFTLRAGVGKDESPTNDTTRTPRLPDNDRQLYSIGASWNLSEHMSIDAAFQRISIDSPEINLGVDAAAGNTSTLVGTFDGHANLYGVSMQYRF